MKGIKAEIKRYIQVGQVYDVTNHYIKRTDHPCFGTRRETIAAVNSNSIHFASSRWGIPWPKAAQAQMDADGTIRFYGGGAGQLPDELFMTLKPVRKADSN